MDEINDSQTPTPSPDTLAARYEAARADAKKARLIVTAALVVTVLAFVFAGYSRVRTFLVAEIPEVAQAALAYAERSETPERLAETLSDAVADVLPRYQEAIAEVYDRDSAEWFRQLEDEERLIREHIEAEWPLVEESIVALVEDQERAASTAMAAYVGADQVRDLAACVGERIEERINDFYWTEIREKREPVVDRIVENLARIAETEPELPTGSQIYLIGVMVELIGVEMQDKYDTPHFSAL